MEIVSMTLAGRPITKKNSQKIISIRKRDPYTGQVRSYSKVMPSAQYQAYEEECFRQIERIRTEHPCEVLIERRVNAKYIYYMPTRARVDLTNLMEATDDILVGAGILLDDNCKIVAGHDGSRVMYDKENPRVEISITEMED